MEPVLLPSLLGQGDPWYPAGPPSTPQGPASFYLWHSAVGLWAGEPCWQGPGLRTLTQLGPGVVTTVLSDQRLLVLN